MVFGDVDGAIDIPNRSDFVNAANLFSSGADARKVRYKADVGNLVVNAGPAAPMAFFHFGGRWDSFFGNIHTQGKDIIHYYTDETVYIKLGRTPDEPSDRQLRDRHPSSVDVRGSK